MAATKLSSHLGDDDYGSGTPTLDKQSDFLGLPLELQASIFLELPELRSAIALRLACRHLNSIYLANEERIKSSLVQRLVAPFHNHYKFLTRLWLSESSIACPPQSGWRKITPESCENFPKTSFAIEVLRHLPDVNDNRNRVYPECFLIHYSNFTPNDFSSEFSASRDEKTLPKFSVEAMRHIIILTAPQHFGTQIMLDTFLGTIYERKVTNNRALRERINRVATPIEDYFAAWKKACEGLDTVYLPNGAYFRPYGDILRSPDDEKYDKAEIEANGKPTQKDPVAKMRWIRHLFRKSGWPSVDWRKEEARLALEQFCQEYESYS